MTAEDWLSIGWAGLAGIQPEFDVGLLGLEAAEGVATAAEVTTGAGETAAEASEAQGLDINFQTNHYINRVGPENVGPVENMGRNIINDPDFAPGTSVCFTCNGVNYEMRTYVLPDGSINVGTIFPIR